MSNQFGGSKNPPWVRQDFGNQNATTMLQTNVTYPFSPAQTQFTQQPLTGNLQATASGGLLPQPGIALPTTLAAVTSAQLNPVSYPIKAQGATTNTVPNVKQRIFTGSVTKMHENFGFVDEEVFFQISCVKGVIPKAGDRVLVEASYNANMPFKWNATRVITLHDNLANNQMISMQQQQQQQQQQHQQQQQQHQQQQQQLKAIQQQALGLMGAAPLMNTSAPMVAASAPLTGGQGLLSNPPGPPPLMTGLTKFQSGGVFSSSNRPAINTGPGLLGDPRPRSLMGSLKETRSGGMSSVVGGGMSGILSSGGGSSLSSSSESQKERDRRERERRERRDVRRKRSRSPPSQKRSRSPLPQARSPVKRRVSRPPPRYVVQVPKILLDVKDASVMSLKSRYSNLYIPSDFFHASFSWVDNFPLTCPFTLGQACTFHIMHKDVSPAKSSDAILEPNDADYLFSAKVMLLSSPSQEEFFKKSCCLAEDLPDVLDTAQHPTRLLQFLVGTRGKNEPMAIGGPWSPSLDGSNPEANPSVLIKTAIRTTKALTGIDLSSCTQWYRFAEIRYFRPESKHKDRLQPARVETVVIFLPDVWTCNPTHLEWNSLQAAYQKQLQLKLCPEAALQQALEEEENGTEKSQEKTEPSHYSTLDPKIMKVGDLRDELELRNASAKGLKSQLIARLSKMLKAEQEKELESKREMEAEKETSKAADIREKEKAREEEEKNEAKRREEEEFQKKEKRERAVLERRYKFPDTPSVIVHPSATAKGGKFDCTTVSLSVLLDYRPEDNKEHSFEVSLFAELFNEMLMRDFGFQIYSAIVCAPQKKEEDKKKEDEKKKDDKKEKDEKDKKEKDKKDDKKTRNEDPSPKRRKTDEKEEKDETADEDNNSVDKEDDNEVKEEESKPDKEKEDKKKKKEEERKTTTNPGLLLAFSYFDQSHCGYLSDKDTEEIIHTLGLKLSRAQIKKLLQKVTNRENFKYRRFTDHIVNDQPVEGEEDEVHPKPDVEHLARGNRESLRKLLELSGAKTESSSGTGAGQEEGDNPGFVYYKGALLDIESLMQRLDRSDKSRAALEKSTQDLTDELKTVKNALSQKEDGYNKLEQDLQKTRKDLDQEKIRSSTAETQNKEWHQLATDSKTHLMNALNCMSTMLTVKKETTSQLEDRKKDEGKDKDTRGLQDAKKDIK